VTTDFCDVTSPYIYVR